jgi:hypothetical protein
MRTLILALAAGAALTVAAEPLDAQGRSGEARARAEARQDARQDSRQGNERLDERDRWDDRTRRDERTRRDDRARQDGRARGGQQARGNGPPFCRNNQGHPVHGRQWCRDKGWTAGGVWGRGGWGDVILRQPRRDRGVYDNRGLGDVLGDIVLGRVDGHARSGGYSGPLTGYWLVGEHGRELQVDAGGIPIARFLDVGADGRVGTVLLRQGR